MTKNFAMCLVLTLIGVEASRAAEQADQMHISCPSAVQGQRITAIEIEITAGRFTAIAALPQGWEFQIDNAPSLHSKIKASTSIGSGALDCSSIRQIAIAYIKTPIGDLTFDMSGSLTVTADFESEKILKLGKDNF